MQAKSGRLARRRFDCRWLATPPPGCWSIAHRMAVAATPPHPLRARPASETAAALRAAGMEVVATEEVADACREAERRVTGEGWVFVTGSLFTVGAALESFGDAKLAFGPEKGNPAHRPG